MSVIKGELTSRDENGKLVDEWLHAEILGEKPTKADRELSRRLLAAVPPKPRPKPVQDGWDPDQPRVPKGSGEHSGEWTEGGGGGGGGGDIVSWGNINVVAEDHAREVWDNNAPGISVEQAIQRMGGGHEVYAADVTAGDFDGEVRFTMNLKDDIRVSRIFNFNDGVVEHDNFKIPKRLQGQGIGKKILKSQFELYDKLGMNKVTLYANIDTGQHAWAKYGFLPYDDEWDSLKNVHNYRIRRENLSISSQARQALNTDDTKGLWALADAPDGKDILLAKARGNRYPTSWGGYLDLHDEDQRRRFRHYVGN